MIVIIVLALLMAEVGIVPVVGTTPRPTTAAPTTPPPTTTCIYPTTVTEPPNNCECADFWTFTCPDPPCYGCLGAKECLYPNPCGCECYIACTSDGDPEGRPCPSGLEWNDVTKRCDWPSEAGCSITTTTSEPTTTTEPTTTSEPTTTTEPTTTPDPGVSPAIAEE